MFIDEFLKTPVTLDFCIASDNAAMQTIQQLNQRYSDYVASRGLCGTDTRWKFTVQTDGEHAIEVCDLVKQMEGVQ